MICYLQFSCSSSAVTNCSSSNGWTINTYFIKRTPTWSSLYRDLHINITLAAVICHRKLPGHYHVMQNAKFSIFDNSSGSLFGRPSDCSSHKTSPTSISESIHKVCPSLTPKIHVWSRDFYWRTYSISRRFPHLFNSLEPILGQTSIWNLLFTWDLELFIIYDVWFHRFYVGFLN